MKLYKLLRSIVIGVALSITTSTAYAADVIAEETKIKVVDAFTEASSSDSFDCIDLKLEGACFYLVFRIYPCKPPEFICVRILPEFSALLTHYNPDLLIASYKRLGRSPLDVSKLLYDKIQLAVAEPILELISGDDVPVDFDNRDLWAANTSESANKKYKSALQYSEIDVIGHPGNALSHYWDVGLNQRNILTNVPHYVGDSLIEGAMQVPVQVKRAAETIVLNDGTTEDRVQEIEGDGEEYWSEHPLTTSLVDQSNNTFVKTVAEISDMIGALDVVDEQIDEIFEVIDEKINDVIEPVQEVIDTVEEITEALDVLDDIKEGISSVGGGSVLTKNLFTFCPADTQMLRPYMLSGANIIQWRYNIPEIVYPQSYRVPIFDSHKRHFIANGSHPTEDNNWGPLFPRNGFVLQADAMKAAAVNASRAAHVVTRDYFQDMNQIHVYSPVRFRTSYGKGIQMIEYPPAYDQDIPASGKWQLMGSKSDDRCIRFGDDDMLPGSIEVAKADGSGTEVIEKDEVPWTNGKHSDDDSYVWTLWRQYSCCPTPQKNSKDIIFKYWDMPEISIDAISLM